MSELFYLDVIGPPDAFKTLATIPSDPEVLYLEETTEHLSDGRRSQSAIANSQAVVDRFTATAQGLGFEVRIRETPESFAEIQDAMLRDNPPGNE